MEKIFISFDLDATLIKPDYNELVWFREIPELYAKKYGIEVEAAKELVIREYNKVGEDDLKWYILGYWLKHLGLVVEEKEILEKYADAVETYEEVIPVLKELKKEYALIISSAMSQSFIDVKLRCDNLFGYFDRVFSAISDFEMIKKKATFYKEVCKKLKIPTSNLIHVGDNYEADYLASRQVGVKAFYLNRTPSHSSSDFHFVSNLSEFAYRLKDYLK